MCECANLDVAHVAVFPKALVNEIHDRRRNGKTQPLAASTTAEDERVQADDRACNVHQRPPTIARVNGRVGLQVNHWVVGVGLSQRRTNHSHGHRTLQTLRTSDCEHQFSQLWRVLKVEWKRGQIRGFNLQQRQVAVFLGSDQLRVQHLGLADTGNVKERCWDRGQDYTNLLCPGHHMRIGHDVTVRVHDHTCANSALTNHDRHI